MTEIDIIKRLTELRDFSTERWILHHSITLGIFDALSEKRKSSKEISKELRLDNKTTKYLMLALSSLDYLTKTDGKFKLKKNTKKYLVKDSDFYLGNRIKILPMYDDFKYLDKRLRHNKIIEPNWPDITEALERLAKPSIDALLKISSELGYEDLNILDIGCGTAMYSILLAKSTKNTKFMCIDQDKNVLKKAKKNVRKYDLEQRIELINTRFEELNIDNMDVVMFNNILHHFNYDYCLDLLKKAHNILNKNGKLAVLEIYENPIFGLNMRLHTKDGECYSSKELNKLLREANFSDIRIANINADTKNIAYFIGKKC